MSRRALAAAAALVLAAALLARTACRGDDAQVAGPPAPAGSRDARPEPTRPQRPRVERAEPEASGGASPHAVAQVGELRIVVVDADAGTPVRTDLRLWRLGVPEDAEFTAGDVLAGESASDAEPVFRDLVPGTYRVQLDGQRRDAEDPPAFGVAAGEVMQAVRFAAPRSFEMSFFAFDEEGRALTEASSKSGRRRTSEMHPGVPTWANPRQSKSAETVGVGGGGRFATSSGTVARDRARVRPSGAFDLGTQAESGRTSSSRHAWSFTFEGRLAAQLDVRSEDAGRGDYVAVVPLLANVPRFDEHVFLPDGRRAVEAGAKIEACVIPVLRTEGGADPLGWTAPFRVTCALDGYERLEVTVARDTATIPDWTMKAAAR
ncbi:MAG: hypothetical protein HMLKMBBP_02046 [Planctomycetes bacterium]|nr:hypothetical protein [Planctomycetota bacterium]